MEESRLSLSPYLVNDTQSSSNYSINIKICIRQPINNSKIIFRSESHKQTIKSSK